MPRRNPFNVQPRDLERPVLSEADRQYLAKRRAQAAAAASKAKRQVPEDLADRARAAANPKIDHDILEGL